MRKYFVLIRARFVPPAKKLKMAAAVSTLRSEMVISIFHHSAYSHFGIGEPDTRVYLITISVASRPDRNGSSDESKHLTAGQDAKRSSYRPTKRGFACE